MVKYNQRNLQNLSNDTIRVVTEAELLDSIIKIFTQAEDLLNRYKHTNVVVYGHIVKDINILLASLAIDDTTKLFLNMIREVVDNVYKDSGGSGITTALIFVKFTKMLLRQVSAGISPRAAMNNLFVDVSSIRNKLINSAKKLHIDNLEEVIDDALLEKYQLAMIKDAILLAGANGKINIEVGNSAGIIVRNGYSFTKLIPMLQCVQSTTWEHVDCKVLCIDGNIESVTELDNIFQACVSSKQPLIIFARKFDNDVLSTITVNNKRNVFNILPVVIPYDLESLNILKDISIACGGGVISSLQGQLISTVNFGDLSTVQFVKTTQGKITIKNSSHKTAVYNHITHLQEKIINLDQERATFLQQRINSLTSRLVTIIISKADSKLQYRFESALRRVQNAIKHGIVHNDKLDESLNNIGAETSKILRNEFINSHTFTIIELNSIFKHVISNCNLLINSSTLLI